MDKGLFGTHLSLIQGVINRMAANSFVIKGWSITIMAAIIALASSLKSWPLTFIVVFPVLLFWWLDAYFFMLEKTFRKLYAHISGLADNEVEYRKVQMKISLDVVSSKADRGFRNRFGYLRSTAVFPIYFLQILITLITAFSIYLLSCQSS
ncbi:Uncharacterised protein [BD1-7 clade bacterium]|uniref:Uncharacterized protein n=1 Tax=BD1-7 clade bacterium TaxID=2029982 RepID=A0A5S9NQI3_9GAMM|nr:Uncharacterised protein [BD1-7 clade bacterium]